MRSEVRSVRVNDVEIKCEDNERQGCELAELHG